MSVPTELYAQFKPTRNLLRQCHLAESLRVVWAYSRFLDDHNLGIPSDIECFIEYRLSNLPEKWFAQPDLEILCREALTHCQKTGVPSQTLRKWNTLANVVNGIKATNEFAYETESSADEFVLTELHRMAHNQFPWQENAAGTNLYGRALKLYGSADFSDMFRDNLRTSYASILKVGMGIIRLTYHDTKCRCFSRQAGN